MGICQYCVRKIYLAISQRLWFNEEVMVLRNFSAEEIDKRNNRHQGLLLLDYLMQMGYRIGVSDQSLVITSTDGFQLQTSLGLCNENVMQLSGVSAKAARA